MKGMLGTLLLKVGCNKCRRPRGDHFPREISWKIPHYRLSCQPVENCGNMVHDRYPQMILLSNYDTKGVEMALGPISIFFVGTMPFTGERGGIFDVYIKCSGQKPTAFYSSSFLKYALAHFTLCFILFASHKQWKYLLLFICQMQKFNRVTILFILCTKLWFTHTHTHMYFRRTLRQFLNII